MAAQYLNCAKGPPKTLTAIAFGIVGHQTATQRHWQIDRFPPRCEKTKSKLGIFGNAVFIPLADIFKRATTNNGHCTVLDDRIVFGTKYHS